ncbi:MAG: hypothetical protein KDD45_11135 [Bdellovibrionales bacterium]|nr:hypothetical protein [Bdellovibrionales bacterium]
MMDGEYAEKKQIKTKPERAQRIHSETIMREKRTHDWSEINRQKRE